MSAKRAILTLAVLLGAIACSAAPAFAAGEAPWWHVNVGSRPSYLAPGGAGVVVVSATDLGDGEVNGTAAPAVVTDTLPVGVTAGSGGVCRGLENGNRWARYRNESCPISSRGGSSVVTCTYNGLLAAYRAHRSFHRRQGRIGTVGLGGQARRRGQRRRWRRGGRVGE